ncbi:MAG: diol dehydratase small subunit [Propionibacterium sp.]|nr:diol dehydratase small subunit [Propionibacterium sp.]
MDQEQLIRTIMAEVMKELGKDQVTFDKPPASVPPAGGGITAAQYPLSEKAGDRIRTSTGKAFADITLAKVKSGELRPDDLRIAKETLVMQAQVADSVGRETLARNLRRASELIVVPDDKLLGIYNALRPYRSTKQDLYDIADDLDKNYGCVMAAQFVREAADVYEQRGRLKRSE